MGVGRQCCLLEKMLLIYSEIMGESPPCSVFPQQLSCSLLRAQTSVTVLLQSSK